MQSKRYRTLVIVLALVALAGWKWKPLVRPGTQATVDLHGQRKTQPAGSADLLLRSAAFPGDWAGHPRPEATQPRLAEAYGKLPLSFEINQGQTDPQVKFVARGRGYTLFLTGDSAVLALRQGDSKGKGQRAKGQGQK